MLSVAATFSDAKKFMYTPSAPKQGSFMNFCGTFGKVINLILLFFPGCSWQLHCLHFSCFGSLWGVRSAPFCPASCNDTRSFNNFLE